MVAVRVGWRGRRSSAPTGWITLRRERCVVACGDAGRRWCRSGWPCLISPVFAVAGQMDLRRLVVANVCGDDAV